MAKHPIYFLQSERLGFRKWSGADTDLAWELWGDSEVTRFIGGPFSREQVQRRLHQEIELDLEYGIQYWPIFSLETGVHIGCCGLRPYRLEQQIYELGFHICRNHWGCGYASESARATIAYAFEDLCAAGLFAGHNPANEPSRALLRKLGFTYTSDEFYAPTGLNHPSYLLEAPKRSL